MVHTWIAVAWLTGCKTSTARQSGLLNRTPHELQTRLRSLLHRPLHLLTHAWPASRQTRWHALPASG